MGTESRAYNYLLDIAPLLGAVGHAGGGGEDEGSRGAQEQEQRGERALETHLLCLRLVDRAQRRGGLSEHAHGAGA
jgi:hypothetical protein